MENKLTYWQVIKSYGFLIMVFFAVVLTWIADFNGAFESIQERFVDFLLNMILAGVYVLGQTSVWVNASPFDKKKTDGN